MFYKQICFLFFSADPDLIFLVSELDVVSPIRIIEFLLYFFFFFWEGRALVRINSAPSDKPNLRPNILRLFQYSFLVLESPGALKGWSFVTIFFVLTIITICKIKEKRIKDFRYFCHMRPFVFCSSIFFIGTSCQIMKLRGKKRRITRYWAWFTLSCRNVLSPRLNRTFLL